MSAELAELECRHAAADARFEKQEALTRKVITAAERELRQSANVADRSYLEEFIGIARAASAELREERAYCMSARDRLERARVEYIATYGKLLKALSAVGARH